MLDHCAPNMPAAWRRFVFANLLLACLATETLGIENAEVVGQWQGLLQSESFPGGIAGSLDFWEVEGKLAGVIGSEYGVFELSKVALEGDGIAVEFLSPLGVGSFEGQISADHALKFQWKIMELSGVGEAKRIDPSSVSALAASDLAGFYSGQATGAMVPEPVDVSLQIDATGDGLSGKIVSPIGEFAIFKGFIKHHRFILHIKNDEEMTGMIVGSKLEDKIDIYWFIAIGAGKATLAKAPAPPPEPQAQSSPKPESKP